MYRIRKILKGGLLVLVGAGMLSVGCKDETGGGTSTTGGTGQGTDGDACKSDECADTETWWWCMWTWSGSFGWPADDGFCVPDEEAAADECWEDCIIQVGPDCVEALVEEDMCDSTVDPPPPRACYFWNPPAAVTPLQTDSFEVDEAFYLDLIQTPELAIWCDDARILAIPGGFRWEDIASGDLADELGFQNGDVPISINGYPLTTSSEAAQAYWALHQGNTFNVTFQRGRSQLTYQYLIR